MGPGHVAGEVLQEQRGRDRAGAAGVVLRVGDRRRQGVLVVALERHPPQRLARGLAGVVHPGGQGLVVGEERADPLAERDLDRTGERGDVDQDGRVELVDGVGHRVREHQPTLGVGVEHLGRPAAVLGEHVAGTQGVAADRVLGGGDEPGDAEGAAHPAQRRHHGHHDRATGHVALHRGHALAGLDREAAGVEGDALADQHHPRSLPAPAGRRVVETDQARRRRGRLADGQDPAEALARQLLLVPDLARQAVVGRPASRPARPATGAT